MGMNVPPTPGLHNIFNADDASALVYDQEVQQELTALLPDGLQTTEELAETVSESKSMSRFGVVYC
jgi:hypothetical protein